MPLVNNTYSIARRELSYFMEHYVRRYPGRFAAMTMADFAQWGDPVLLKDDDFAKRCIERLEDDVAAGACGLKVTKELGLILSRSHRRHASRGRRAVGADLAAGRRAWACPC